MEEEGATATISSAVETQQSLSDQTGRSWKRLSSPDSQN